MQMTFNYTVPFNDFQLFKLSDLLDFLSDIKG